MVVKLIQVLTQNLEPAWFITFPGLSLSSAVKSTRFFRAQAPAETLVMNVCRIVCHDVVCLECGPALLDKHGHGKPWAVTTTQWVDLSQAASMFVSDPQIDRTGFQYMFKVVIYFSIYFGQ